MATLLGQTVTVDVDDRRRAVGRVALWVLLVLSVLAAMWGTPRSASQDDFARAVKAGDVRALQTYDGRYGLEWTALSIQVQFGTTSSRPVVLWEDQRGMLHRTDLSWLGGGTPGSVGDTIDLLATIDATAQAAGVPVPTVDEGLGLAEHSAVPMGLLTLLFLGILVFGPQPRRVTKWGMLWVICIPLGLGMAWWLARDAPFSPAMNRVAQPVPGDKGMLPNGIRRTGGGVAFLGAWGISVLVGIAAAVLIGLVSTTNGGSVPTEPWSLVMAPAAAYGP